MDDGAGGAALVPQTTSSDAASGPDDGSEGTPSFQITIGEQGPEYIEFDEAGNVVQPRSGQLWGNSDEDISEVVVEDFDQFGWDQFEEDDQEDDDEDDGELWSTLVSSSYTGGESC